MTTYIFRFFLALTFLFYASVQDILNREVPNKVWLISIPLCLILDYVDFSLGHIDLILFLVSPTVGFILGFALFFLGFYGGADAKALILLATATPSYSPNAAFLVTRIFPLPALLAFFCSTLLSSSYPLAVLSLNLIDSLRGKDLLSGIEEKNFFKRLLLYMLVRKVKLEDLRGFKRFPAEKVVVENGVAKRRPVYNLHAETNVTKLVKELEEHKELLKDGVLASPTIPMIVFLTIGFAFSNLVSIL